MMTREPSSEQLSLEREMVDLGEKRFLDNVTEAKQEGRESVTPASVTLLKAAVEPFALAIENEYKAKHSGPGIHRQAFKDLKGIVKPEVLAYLTLKATLDCISKGDSLTSMSAKVGAYVETELQLSSYLKQNRKLMDKVKRSVQKRTANVNHQRTVMIHSANKAGLEWDQMQSEYKLVLGLKLINLMIESTGLFKLETVQQKSQGHVKKRQVKRLIPTEKTVKWLTKRNKHLSLLRPLKLPCCDIPKPWTEIQDGGYFSLKTSLIRFNNPVAKRDSIDNLGGVSDQLQPVYDVLNAIQETPWKVNKEVLEVLKHLWYVVDEDVVNCLPPKNERPIPPFPGEDAEKEVIKEWKHLSTRIYSDNVRKRSKKLAFAKTLWVAETFQKYKKIYFPHNLDFRGRVYPIPDFFNPQGDDTCRGLLLFANEKPVKTDKGRSYFLRYGASLFGLDKESRNKQTEWVNEMQQVLISCADEPLRHDNLRFWSEADKPWQFLAWCFEFRKFYWATTNNEEFVTGFPIMVDGTCNGLQHLSALMRDEVGAEAVNLCNTGEKPNDIYEIVAQEARKIMPCAPVKIDRKLCKRPVMTTPYGSTLFGYRQQIHEELKKRADRITTDKGEWDDWELIQNVSNAIYQGVSHVIVKSREFMDWLQEIAEIISDRNWPIEWLSPFGFHVFQNYYETKSRRLRTVLHGQLKGYRPKVVQSIPGTQNVQKNKNAISPNFIHSLDAAHLMFVVNDMRYEHGIKDLYVVHDCFGTHADDVPLLVDTLKETFIEMYSSNNIIDSFIEDYLKPYLDKADYFRVVEKRPKLGTFNINKVRGSDFFFS